MLDFITVPLVTGICIFGFYKLVELFVRKRERIMLIERISQLENIDSNKIDLSRIFGKEPYRNGRFVALRAGMLLIGVGLGLLVGFIIVYNTFGPLEGDFYDRSNGMAELIYGSTTLLFGGLGLIAAFIIEHKLRKG